jgi:hypothetical protein
MLGLGTAVNKGGFVSAAEPLLLDTYSGAAAAYSLRKLSSTYSGPALQVRRASDNVEVDVSFDTNGVVSLNSPVTNVPEETSGSSQGSTTATNLGEFVADAGYTDVDSLGSADSALVQCWYDQSSNSNDATQTTATKQPKIYDGTGGVVTENSKPAVDFDGSSDQLDYVGLTETTLTSFHVAKPDQTNSGDAFLGWDGTTGNGFFRYNSTGNMRLNFFGGFNTSTTYTAAQNLVFAVFGTALKFGYNGATAETGSATGITTSGIRIGQKGNVDYFNGKAQEIVVYASDQSSNRTNIEDNINTFYSIY